MMLTGLTMASYRCPWESSSLHSCTLFHQAFCWCSSPQSFSVIVCAKWVEYSFFNFHCICESLSQQTLESLLPTEHYCGGQLRLCCSSSGDNLPVSSLSLSQMSTDANCCVPPVCTPTGLLANAHLTVFVVLILAYYRLPNSLLNISETQFWQ